MNREISCKLFIQANCELGKCSKIPQSYFMVDNITVAICLQLSAYFNQFQNQDGSNLSVAPSFDPNASTSSMEENLPKFSVEEEIPASVKATLGEYRLGKETDFVSSIRVYARENPTEQFTCSIFTADFNQDGLNDYALLLVAQTATYFVSQSCSIEASKHLLQQ
jgi:hypothetical protein